MSIFGSIVSAIFGGTKAAGSADTVSTATTAITGGRPTAQAEPEIKSHDPPPRTVNHVRSNYSTSYLGTDPSLLIVVDYLERLISSEIARISTLNERIASSVTMASGKRLSG